MRTVLPLLLFMVHVSFIYAQQTDTNSVKAPDTLVLAPSQVKAVEFGCLVVDSYGSGDEELIAINSQSDAISAFGYNCEVPDSDYTAYTLLCCSVMSNSDANVKYKVKTAGDNLILEINAPRGKKRTLLHILVPRMSPNGNIHLEFTYK